MLYITKKFYVFLKKIHIQKKFRKLNKHNNLEIANLCDISRIKAGKASYGTFSLISDSQDDIYLQIGNYCSLADNITFLLGGDHFYKGLSTYPFAVKRFNQEKEALSKGNIIIEDDVWIGQNVTICSGVTIGKGSIIAAGSVITKSIPPYSIAGGNPAKIIKSRFEDNPQKDKLIEKLTSTDLVFLFDKLTVENKDLVYSELTLEKLEEILK